MMQNEPLTTEELSRKFDNQFNLVNYAIHRLQDVLKTGQARDDIPDSQNPVIYILRKIGKEKPPALSQSASVVSMTEQKREINAREAPRRG